ncbi:5'-nucleotidase [Rugosimonospora africana]|uniref:5'-nucleotidase n=1 Tax=Rugosimonospora africana TaxID=556532 RepID=A0A8J3R5A4_9ACTN|nr:5'-nucleotidase [Rugosimonospora africana]GIH21560.1 5'-nucleotidase [Rugosimonospora africana]
MSYDLDKRLVIGIASSALFDLAESDTVFRNEGEESYRRYQQANLSRPLRGGVAFPFIKRLLSLNDLAVTHDDPPVEVIVLSRNDPDTGLRVMRSIEYHELPITRAIFTQGRSPHQYMPALHMSLFLSANDQDVREAVEKGLPAGRVLESAYLDDDHDGDLRIAFDFDGVLADDASERVMQEEGLARFMDYETANLVSPHTPGPLQDFLREINKIQRLEENRKLTDPQYSIRLRVSIITSRSAPAHERAVASLKSWGVTVNDAFFLGGIDKGAIVKILRPHIFFDDQEGHLRSTSLAAPSVHVPFGVLNAAKTDAVDLALKERIEELGPAAQ